MTRCSLCGQVGHRRNNSNYHPPLWSGGENTFGGLRGVLPTPDIVADYRDSVDAYSNTPIDMLDNPEKDHVFEIQLGDAVYEHFKQSRRMVTTRNEVQRMKDLFNSVENCNVTSMKINRSKQGPFRSVKNELVRNNFATTGNSYGVDDYVFCRNGQRRANKYEGFSTPEWWNIKSEVVVSYDYIEDNLHTAIHGEDDLLYLQATFNTVFEAMKLED